MLGAAVTVTTDDGPLAVPVFFERPRHQSSRRAWVHVSATPGVTRTVNGHRVRQQVDAYATDPTGLLANLAAAEVERLLTEQAKTATGVLPGDSQFNLVSCRKLLGFTREEPGPGDSTVWHAVLEVAIEAQERRLVGTRF